MDIAVATRPVQPDDAARLVRLWPRLSPDTVYRRFHSPLHDLPPETVRRLVTVDHDRREAVAAVVGGEVVGVVRYDRSPDDPATAEFAILVEDAWQGTGLGRPGDRPDTSKVKPRHSSSSQPSSGAGRWPSTRRAGRECQHR